MLQEIEPNTEAKSKEVASTDTTSNKVKGISADEANTESTAKVPAVAEDTVVDETEVATETDTCVITVAAKSVVHRLVTRGVRAVQSGKYSKIQVLGLGTCTHIALLVADQIKARTSGLYKQIKLDQKESQREPKEGKPNYTVFGVQVFLSKDQEAIAEFGEFGFEKAKPRSYLPELASRGKVEAKITEADSKPASKRKSLDRKAKSKEKPERQRNEVQAPKENRRRRRERPQKEQSQPDAKLEVPRDQEEAPRSNRRRHPREHPDEKREVREERQGLDGRKEGQQQARPDKERQGPPRHKVGGPYRQEFGRHRQVEYNPREAGPPNRGDRRDAPRQPRDDYMEVPRGTRGARYSAGRFYDEASAEMPRRGKPVVQEDGFGGKPRAYPPRQQQADRYGPPAYGRADPRERVPPGAAYREPPRNRRY